MHTKKIQLLFVFSFVFHCARTQRPASVHPLAKRTDERCLANVAEAGVWSENGKSDNKRRFNLDLDHDGNKEVALADKALCQNENCYWNLYRIEEENCHVYLGAVSGSAFDVEEPHHVGKGFSALRTRWSLKNGSRVFLQKYVFEEDVYQLRQAAICLIDERGQHQCDTRIY